MVDVGKGGASATTAAGVEVLSRIAVVEVGVFIWVIDIAGVEVGESRRGVGVISIAGVAEDCAGKGVRSDAKTVGRVFTRRGVSFLQAVTEIINKTSRKNNFRSIIPPG